MNKLFGAGAAFTSADMLYAHVLEALLAGGDVVAPRGQETRELRGITLALIDARKNVITWPTRKLNYPFMVAEWLWILLGHRDVATIAWFNKQIAAFSDDGETFAGAYGPPVTAQLGWVIDTLRRDPDTRQAVLTIWRPTPAASKDVPCTISMQFFIRNGAVEMHTYMRSNDAWLGLPYDLFTFTQLQAYVAQAVGCSTGMYRHTVGSLHLYARNFAVAENLVTHFRAGDVLCSRVVSPPLTALPAGFDGYFTNVLSTAAAAHTDTDGDNARLPPPWNVYASLLAYRAHRDASRIPRPYRALFA